MIILSECREGMSHLPGNSVASIVTDPPYGLSKQPNIKEVLGHWLAGDDYSPDCGGFMGKKWDSFVPGPLVWAEAYRVLKPGGYIVAFAGSRTVDLMSMSLRIAGFEVVDMLHWLYGTGFPKSMDVAKQIDARDRLGPQRAAQLRFTEWMRGSGVPAAAINTLTQSQMSSHYLTAASQPAVATREHFEAMRPHFTCAVPQWVEDLVDERTVESENLKRRKVVGKHTDPSQAAAWRAGMDGSNVAPPSDITEAYSDEAKRWEGWGTALKPCHEPIIMARKPLDGTYANNIMAHGVGALNIDGCRVGSEEMARTKSNGVKISENGSMTGGNYGRVAAGPAQGRWPGNVLHDGCLPEPMDRYFYSAKATREDRDAGLAALEAQTGGQATGRKEGTAGLDSPRSGAGRKGGAKNIHPTVKPTDLMRWLCRLVTPPGGLVLDPFTGSGSTGRGAALEGFNFIGFEMDPDYFKIAEARVADALGGVMPSKIYLTTYDDDKDKTPHGPSMEVGSGPLESVEGMLGGAKLRKAYAAMRIYELSPGVCGCLSRVPFC